MTSNEELMPQALACVATLRLLWSEYKVLAERLCLDAECMPIGVEVLGTLAVFDAVASGA